MNKAQFKNMAYNVYQADKADTSIANVEKLEKISKISDDFVRDVVNDMVLRAPEEAFVFVRLMIQEHEGSIERTVASGALSALKAYGFKMIMVGEANVMDDDLMKNMEDEDLVLALQDALPSFPTAVIMMTKKIIKKGDKSVEETLKGAVEYYEDLLRDKAQEVVESSFRFFLII